MHRAWYVGLTVFAVIWLIIGWIRFSPPPPPPPSSSAEEQTKAAALGVLFYFMRPVMLELDAQQRWNERYRRCDPEPGWYPWDRTIAILSYHIDLMARRLVGFFREVLRMNPLELTSNEMVRAVASAIAGPPLSLSQVSIDITGEIFFGRTHFVPRYTEPMCHVYCDDDGCKYI